VIPVDCPETGVGELAEAVRGGAAMGPLWPPVVGGNAPRV
jgi:hypothetical protein